MKTVHPAQAKALNCPGRNQTKQTIKECGSDPKKPKTMQRGEYIHKCVMLVSIHMHPLSLLSCQPFRDLTYIHASNANMVINSTNITGYLQKTAQTIRDLIKDEVRHKMISLKLDIATRQHRSMLALNIQYYSATHQKIVIRTLGFVELKNRHTAIYLETVINEIFETYNIDKRNIYSYTPDNGANMISLAALLKSKQQSLLLSDELVQQREEALAEWEEDDEFTEIFNDTSEVENLVTGSVTNPLATMTLVRCFAHILQLAVHDALVWQ